MPTARDLAVRTLSKQLARYPDMPVMNVETTGLDPRDARLAVAIHRTSLQRLITIRHALERRLSGPLGKLEPRLAAVLVAGAAQLLFMERIPVHAAVDEMVDIARHTIRAGAGKLANAVLRRVADLVLERREDQAWRPDPAALPLTPSGVLRLTENILPPVADWAEHLSIATSHPRWLLEQWQAELGEEQATAIALHGLRNAPLIIHGPPASPSQTTPHAAAGFQVWRGDYASLTTYLAASSDRWVQDPTAALPAQATATLDANVIFDFCAGRGTKTRQLAAIHPRAEIFATDVDEQRLSDLDRVFTGHSRVKVIRPDQMSTLAGRVDLLLLDVPCTNTGVLGRRLEARYRCDDRAVESLVDVQKSIMHQSAPLLKRHGEVCAAAVVYSTCSIDRRENERQAQWLARNLRLRITQQQTTLPGGAETDHHDGGYFAVMRGVG